MQAGSADHLGELERLAKLRTEGALSAEEYSRLKSKLLQASESPALAVASGASDSDAVPADGFRAGPEPITLATVFGWAWAVFFGILGPALMVNGQWASGSVVFLSALLVFPPLAGLAFANADLSALKWIVFPISLGLLIVAGSWLGLTHPVAVELPANNAPPPTADAAPSDSQPDAAQNAAPDVSQSANADPGSPAANTPDSSATTQTTPDPADAAALAAMQSRFGNTIVTQSAAAEWHLYFKIDGTVTGTELRTGYRVGGAWTISDGEVCVSFDPPIPGTSNPECKPVGAHQIGDRWLSAGSVTTLLEGIQ